jgi:hypothetical protein
MKVEPVYLDPGDAVELGELLEFLGGWLVSDRENLAGSLCRFVGGAGYEIDDLRADVARLAFLLGANDGERLFGEDER